MEYGIHRSILRAAEGPGQSMGDACEYRNLSWCMAVRAAAEVRAKRGLDSATQKQTGKAAVVLTKANYKHLRRLLP